MSRLLAGIGLIFALGLSSASARPVTDDEAASLATRVANFETAIQARDYEAILSISPPPMLQHFADATNMSVDDLKTALASQMEQVLETVTLVSYGMDLDAAQHRELADGTPYLLIPTETVMETETTGRMKVETFTLALLDQGEWYLLRTSDAPMVGVLSQVYPQFSGVTFPADSTTAVEK